MRRILKPAVYSVLLTQQQSRQLRESRDLVIWSRFCALDLVRVIFRVVRPVEWSFRAEPQQTLGVHEQLAELGKAV